MDLDKDKNGEIDKTEFVDYMTGKIMNNDD